MNKRLVGPSSPSCCCGLFATPGRDQPTSNPTPTATHGDRLPRPRRPRAPCQPPPHRRLRRATPVPTVTAAPPTTAASPTSAAIDVTGDDGVSITLAQPADKVVSLTPATSELMFALGAGDRLVGRTDYDDYPPEVATCPPSRPSRASRWRRSSTSVPIWSSPAATTSRTHDDITRMRDLGYPRAGPLCPDMPGVLADIELVGTGGGRGRRPPRTITDGIQARFDEVTAPSPACRSRGRSTRSASTPAIYGPAPDSFVADMVKHRRRRSDHDQRSGRRSRSRSSSWSARIRR